ncbi:MAG: restriction endonuclease [Verrucomicrobia bacterium]|nr:restriction endonuclease [Verrucomicrobiota bacterium]
MNRNFIGREKEIAQIADGFAAGKRIGIIEGLPGVGKSALARAFSEQERIRFPGGINFVNAFNDGQLDEAIKRIKASSLLVIDDAECVTPSIAENIKRICEASSSINALLTTRMAPALDAIRKSQEAFQLMLEPFSQIDFSKFASLFEIPKSLRENIAELTQLNPLMLHLTSELVARNEYQWNDIARTLRDFEYPGLVDPRGKPLDSKSREVVITDITEINDEMIALLRKNPALMREMHPRDFEKLIAELLERAGYVTELTPSTNDGGVDIYAARNDGVGKFLYLVECKRYGERNPVGVQIVRSLHGVVQQQRANGGLVVTSSYFTKGAKEFTSEISHQMHLHDYINLQQWLGVLGD